MLTWCGNVDIQFIGEKSASLATHITKCQIKAEKSFVSDNFSSFCSTKLLYSCLWIFTFQTLSNHDCGALQAADAYLEQIIVQLSDRIDVKIHRSHKLKNKNQLSKLSSNAIDIYCSSWIDNY